jgi:hypothetical protein
MLAEVTLCELKARAVGLPMGRGFIPSVAEGSVIDMLLPLYIFLVGNNLARRLLHERAICKRFFAVEPRLSSHAAFQTRLLAL